MGLWHGVEHWERNKIMEKTETELFIQTWPEVRLETRCLKQQFESFPFH